MWWFSWHWICYRNGLIFSKTFHFLISVALRANTMLNMRESGEGPSKNSLAPNFQDCPSPRSRSRLAWLDVVTALCSTYLSPTCSQEAKLWESWRAQEQEVTAAESAAQTQHMSQSPGHQSGPPGPLVSPQRQHGQPGWAHTALPWLLWSVARVWSQYGYVKEGSGLHREWRGGVQGGGSDNGAFSSAKGFSNFWSPGMMHRGEYLSHNPH